MDETTNGAAIRSFFRAVCRACLRRGAGKREIYTPAALGGKGKMASSAQQDQPRTCWMAKTTDLEGGLHACPLFGQPRFFSPVLAFESACWPGDYRL
jgi:hypothetical protein